MVTYGGMGRKPVCVPTGRLIFNDVALRGFWLSRWTQTHGKAERRVMIKEIMVRVNGERQTTEAGASVCLVARGVVSDAALFCLLCVFRT